MSEPKRTGGPRRPLKQRRGSAVWIRNTSSLAPRPLFVSRSGLLALYQSHSVSVSLYRSVSHWFCLSLSCSLSLFLSFFYTFSVYLSLILVLIENTALKPPILPACLPACWYFGPEYINTSYRLAFLSQIRLEINI